MLKLSPGVINLFHHAIMGAAFWGTIFKEGEIITFEDF